MKLSFAVLVILILTDWVIFNTASATGYNHDHPHEHEPSGDTFVTEVTEVHNDTFIAETNITSYHLDDDAIEAVMAGAMAADAINFSAHTRKKQFGIGLGHYRGENSFALGFGQLIETENYEILLSLKAAYIEHDDDVAVGAGATIEVE